MDNQLTTTIMNFRQKAVACEQRLTQVTIEMSELKKQKSTRQITPRFFAKKKRELSLFFKKNKEEYALLKKQGATLVAACQIPQRSDAEIEELLQLLKPFYLEPLVTAIQTYYAPQIHPCRFCERAAQLCSRSGGWSVDCLAANPLTAALEEITWCPSDEQRLNEAEADYLFPTPQAAVLAWNSKN